MVRINSHLCFVFGLVGLLLASGRALPQTPKREDTSPLQVEDLQADARLNATVTLTLKRQPLDACMRTLSEKSEIHFTVAPDIATRRVSLFVPRLSLRRLMLALSQTTSLSWQRLPDPSNTPVTFANYRLYRTKATLERELSVIRESEQREEQEAERKRTAVLDAMEKALQNRNGKTGIADLVATLTPEQKRQIAEVAIQEIGLISANNQSHFHNRLTFATPFSEMPPAAQSAVRDMLGQQGSEYGPNAQKGADLTHCSVGLIASDGVRLGIVPPDGSDVWVSPGDSILREGISGIDDGTPSEIGDALERAELLRLTGMPQNLLSKRIRFPQGLPVASLPSLTEYLSAQTGVCILTDDFLQSVIAYSSFLLTDQEEYTLAEALPQVARSFAHRITWNYGVLCLQTLTPGRDLRAEPPASLLHRLRESYAKQTELTLSDYVAIGRLSRLQLDRLIFGHLPDVPPVVMGRLHLHPRYPILHFYALLTPEQRKRAESPEGFPCNQWSLSQKRAALLITDVGLPERTDVKAARGKRKPRPGFYVQRESVSEKTERITLRVVSDSRPSRTTAFTFIVQRQEPH